MKVELHPQDIQACINTKVGETLHINANSIAFTSVGNPAFASFGNQEAVNSFAKTVYD